MTDLNKIELTPDDQRTGTAGRVLVVDDERNIRSTMQMTLRNAGYQVDLAADGNEAEACFEKSIPDAVILDVRLPGRSGLELLKAWKSEWPELAIILMSGEATLTEALQGLKEGAFDFIEKPIMTARLLTSVSHAVERSKLRESPLLGGGDVVVGDSKVLMKTLENSRKIATTKARVLITGESGTGKDLIARYIHRLSARADRPFIKLNCASIPHDLIESELFGHIKGAFTGATSARRGHFESANGGTLFLDEVGELPLPAQAKMLRALQNGEITLLGTSDTVNVDVRVIAATNRDLKQEVAKGTFREDLYYRLAVVEIQSPALRDRKEDIPQLVRHFTRQLADEYGMAPKDFDDRALTAMMNYPWPGNVRELRNVLERVMILAGATIGLADLPPEIASCVDPVPAPLRVGASAAGSESGIEPWHHFKERTERAYILQALRHFEGNISEAARQLQVERQTIHKWLKSYQIERVEY